MKQISLLCFVLLCLSCGERNLTAIETTPPTTRVNPITGTAELSYCLVQDEIAPEVKTIVMLDESGSNCINDDTHGNCGYPNSPDAKATDPQRIKRTKGLLKYLSDTEFSEKEYFALMGFYCDIESQEHRGCSQNGKIGTVDPDAKPSASGLGTALNYTPDNEFTPFMRNLSSNNKPFNQVVRDFSNRKDGRFGTNFKAALVQLRSSIIKDAQNAKRRYEEELAQADDPSKVKLTPAFYKIVFASDGAPTDTGSNHYQSELIDYIKDEIVALRDDVTLGDFIQEVVMSAAFYHHTLDSDQSRVAKKLIEDMATAGNGKFLFFDTDSSDIDFESLLDIPVKKINTTQEYLMVTNINTLWGWETDELNQSIPKIYRDSDGDGIHDFEELPSCIHKKDCDNNGVSDAVESILFGGSVCKIRAGTNFCEEDAYQIDPSVCQTVEGMIDADNDGLTDCEERQLLISDKGIGSYDHNKDQIPDGLALRNRLDLTKSEGVDSNRSQRNIHDDDDTISNFDEIKHFTPREFDNNLIENLTPYKYTRRVVPSPKNPLHKCYQVTVEDIPLSSPSDKIEVHLLQKEITGTGKLYYKRVIKEMSDGKVIFNHDEINN